MNSQAKDDIRIHIMKQFIILSDIYGKDIVKNVYTEFLMVILPDQDLVNKITNKEKKDEKSNVKPKG